jgi:CMP-N,N'-diacetyllegionaminic acid synthase
MKTVALLTGRGNSELRDKNILEVCGKPLLCYPADAAKQSNLIDDFYVSSDDEKILSIANSRGFKKIKRPNELSQANSKHKDVIIHALEFIKKRSLEPDILVVLLANNVCIKKEWIDECIKEIINDPSITAVVPSISDLDHHPYRAKKKDNAGFLVPFFDFGDKEISSNRQDIGDCFFLCHNFWVLNIRESIYANNGQPPWVFMGCRVKPYQIDWSIDVHTEKDLIISENWIRANL